MFGLNCADALNRVRRRIVDTSENMFSDDEVLEAMDEALQPIFTTVRLAGESHEMDEINIPKSDFTDISTGVLEFSLPEIVADIREVEGVTAAELAPVPLPRAYIQEKDLGRGFGSSTLPAWFFSKFGRPGRIQLRGRANEFKSFNIWFTRRWAPMHFGTAASGTTTTLVFDASPDGGVVIPRDDVYSGLDLEVTADPTEPTNVGALARIQAYVGSTRTVTFEKALPAAANLTTTYALVIPLDPELTKYFIEETAYELLSRLDETENLLIMERRLGFLRERFSTSLRMRQTTEPKRVYSSRRRAAF